MGGGESRHPINSNFIMSNYRSGTGIGIGIGMELALITSVDN
jgi:hypothetical protein